MEKPPAFQWYPKDFLTDPNVISMTNEERGVYIMLLSHCWLQEGLPDDMALVRRLANVQWQFARCLAFVTKFFFLKDKRWHHKRLDYEREKQVHNRLQQQKNSFVRWKKPMPMQSHGNAAALPMQSSSSPSAFADSSLGSSKMTTKEMQKILIDNGVVLVGHESDRDLQDKIKARKFSAKEIKTI